MKSEDYIRIWLGWALGLFLGLTIAWTWEGKEMALLIALPIVVTTVLLISTCVDSFFGDS